MNSISSTPKTEQQSLQARGGVGVGQQMHLSREEEQMLSGSTNCAPEGWDPKQLLRGTACLYLKPAWRKVQLRITRREARVQRTSLLQMKSRKTLDFTPSNDHWNPNVKKFTRGKKVKY